MYHFDRKEYERRMKWFLDARFGMFVHWGLYAIPARGEWVRCTEEMDKSDYMRYFYEFDPRALSKPARSPFLSIRIRLKRQTMPYVRVPIS